ncbi:hypothetical protein [Alkalicoccus luteus]|uniref:hypothetical protein n=1 Tax=Alkalicoccus luteus TaxID=1237094 RepID=UPI00403475DA
MYIGFQSVRIERDVTRIQRAGKGAGQSAAGSGDDVIQRGWIFRFGFDSVKLLHTSVNAKIKRVLKSFQIGLTVRGLLLFDPNVR